MNKKNYLRVKKAINNNIDVFYVNLDNSLIRLKHGATYIIYNNYKKIEINQFDNPKEFEFIINYLSDNYEIL